MTVNQDDLVIMDYKDLVALSNCAEEEKQSKLFPLLNKAFGATSTTSSNNNNNDPANAQSLGLIAIRNIPNFIQAKDAFLPLAHKLATLPTDYLATYLTDEISMYNAGWSYGKEKLKDDKPDLAKASFYFNPVTDEPGSKEDRKMYPASYPVNKWPHEDKIPNFDKCGKNLGLIMKEVVALLAHHIDEYVKSQCGGYRISIGNEMENTEKVKGRLLYYFPHDVVEKTQEEGGKDNNEYDSWIGWHNDSGFLTALAGDMYVDHETGENIPKEDIDPNAGLYIQDRNGCIKHINIPNDCMAIQIGECMQIVTGGHVVATPHCVRGADPNWRKGLQESGNISNLKGRHIARISFPCFVDTVPSFKLTEPSGRTRNDVLMNGVQGCAKVPPLEARWTQSGMDFGSFLQQTFALYYDWNKQE